MASLGMGSPYEFSAVSVDKQVTKTSPGNYALGYIQETEKGNEFIVLYVGRSDTNVRDRLKQHLDEDDRYTHFKYSYATSPKAAFEKECINYHDFRLPNNKYHPDRPARTHWKCPRCGQFDD